FVYALSFMRAERSGVVFYPTPPWEKFPGHPGDIEFADRCVLHPPNGSALAQMRMRHGLVEGEDRRTRHTFRLQRRDSRIAARKAAEPALDDLLERRIGVASPPWRVEAAIIPPFSA